MKGYEGATDPVVRAGTNGLFYFAGVAFTRGPSQPSAIFVARYMDLNNVEAGDPFGYAGTNRVDWDTGARFLDKVALATDIPRSGATCTITSKQVHPEAGDGDDAPGDHSRRQRLRRLCRVHRFRSDRAVGDHALAVDRLRRVLEHADRAEHGVAPGAEPADCCQPDRRRRLRLVAAIRVPDAGRRRDGREIDQRRLHLQQTAARVRRQSLRSAAPQGRRSAAMVFRPWRSMRPGASISHGPIAATRRYAATLPPATRALSSRRRPPAPHGRCRARSSPPAIGHQLMPAMAFHGGKLRILYYDLREDVSRVVRAAISTSCRF